MTKKKSKDTLDMLSKYEDNQEVLGLLVLCWDFIINDILIFIQKNLMEIDNEEVTNGKDHD